ncbi:MAG: CDP-diacylglycerol--glycerol-3-phosphate 3-phosphatidyltransferase [Alphaproteobacteria bacterium CG_4_9_14_3_um_filter_47_13]|nr:MAG: CDP-diacylglycerol--glycerol-3-phosphate 3-phosphatidyltransferase [Alphaproteobacteria bacterium CG_4_9_14_3_um_filter_47_13]
MKKNLANKLTLTRLALLPFIIILLFLPEHWAWAAWTCLVLYIIGALTDFLDGWVARKFDQVTEFGKLFDPIADKIFVVAILVMLIESGRVEWIGTLAILVILVREFTISGLREFLGGHDIKLPVTSLAKWKTATQMLATGLLIISPVTPLYIDLFGLGCLIAAASLTALTGWHYLQGALEHFKKSHDDIL